LSTPGLDTNYLLIKRSPEGTVEQNATTLSDAASIPQPLPLVMMPPKAEIKTAPQAPLPKNTNNNATLQPKGNSVFNGPSPLVASTPSFLPSAKAGNSFGNSVFNVTSTQSNSSALQELKFLPKRNLADDIQGYGTVLTAEGVSQALRQKLATVKDDKQQLSMVQDYASSIEDKYSAEAVAGTLSALREGVVVDASKAIVNIKAPEDVKTHAGVAVAEQIKNIKEEKRLEVLKVTLDTKNEKVQIAAAPKIIHLAKEQQESGLNAVTATKNNSVIASLAPVAHQVWGSIQDKVAKAVIATNIESAQKIVANHQGDFVTEVQLGVVDGLLNSKHSSVRQLSAGNTYKLADDNQEPATMMVIATGDKEIIQAGVNNAHLTAKTKQVNIAKAYFDTNIEQVQKTIAQNEGKFAKENQRSIYDILMTSEHQSVLETAAGKIYTMHKDNQLYAVNKTKETNNEGAINKAAEQITKYDETCKKDIEQSLLALNNQRINETIQTAKAQAVEEADKAEATKVAEREAETARVAATRRLEAEETGTTTVKPEAFEEQVQLALSENNLTEIGDLLKNASDVQIEKLIASLSTSQLGPFLRDHMSELPKYIVQNALDKLPSGPEKDLLFKDFTKNLSSSALAQAGLLFDNSMQELVIAESSKNGKLSDINKDLLSASAKEDYAKYDKPNFNQYC